MSAFLEKITLYDIVAMMLPGAIVILSIIGIIPIETIRILQIIDNTSYGILFALLSYCLGWILSEICRNIFENNFSLFYKCFLIVDIMTIFFSFLLFPTYDEMKLRILMVKIFLNIMIWIILWIIFKNFQKNEKNFHLEEPIKSIATESISKYFGKTIKKDDLISYISIIYGLIQTNTKYNRIHNYNASKSFSRNLSGSFFFVAISFAYNSFQCNGLKFDVLYFLGYIVSICFSYILYKRYIYFGNKVKLYTFIFFNDFVKAERRNNHESSK